MYNERSGECPMRRVHQLARNYVLRQDDEDSPRRRRERRLLGLYIYREFVDMQITFFLEANDLLTVMGYEYDNDGWITVEDARRSVMRRIPPEVDRRQFIEELEEGLEILENNYQQIDRLSRRSRRLTRKIERMTERQ